MGKAENVVLNVIVKGHEFGFIGEPVFKVEAVRSRFRGGELEIGGISQCIVLNDAALGIRDGKVNRVTYYGNTSRNYIVSIQVHGSRFLVSSRQFYRLRICIRRTTDPGDD